MKYSVEFEPHTTIEQMAGIIVYLGETRSVDARLESGSDRYKWNLYADTTIDDTAIETIKRNPFVKSIRKPRRD